MDCKNICLTLSDTNDKENSNLNIINITVDKDTIITEDQNISFFDEDKIFTIPSSEETKILTISSSEKILDIDNTVPSTSFETCETEAIANTVPSTSFKTETIAASISESEADKNISSIAGVSLIKTETSKEKDITNFVTKVLNGITDGKDLYKRYYGPNGFNTSDRAKLSEILIKAELDGDTETRISKQRFNEIVKDILEIFSSEIASTWYSPAVKVNGKQIYPKGVLYNKYVSIGKKYRASGSRSGTRSGNITTVPIQTEDDVALSLSWLKTRVEPWSQVEKHWKITANYRLEVLRSETVIVGRKHKKLSKEKHFCHKVFQYISLYPVLLQNDGYKLFEEDFKVLYSEKENKLFEEKEKFVLNIRELIRRKKNLTIDSEPKTDDTSILDHDFIEAAWDLTQLIQPVSIGSLHKNKNNKKPWRPSMFEMKNGFILHVLNIRELETEINRVKKRLDLIGRTLQPFPALIGPSVKEITDSYVVIDNVRYRVPSPLRAIDICFKSYQVLHANYPFQSDSLWLFIQKAVYDIHTEWDNRPAVDTLVQQYKLLRLT